jgi:hypothetical protein
MKNPSVGMYLKILRRNSITHKFANFQLAIPTQVIQTMESFFNNPPLFIFHKHFTRIPYDQQARWSAPLLFDSRRDVLETSPYDALIGTTCTFEDGNGKLSGITFVDKALDESGEAVQRHKEDECAGSDEFRRVERRAFATRTGADKDLVSDAAMCGGYRGEQGCAEGTRDAWQDTGDIAMSAEEVVFFTTSTIDVWISLLYPYNHFAGFQTL